MKRLFFALQAEAPWTLLTPPSRGRILAEEVRHMTLVFLGNVDEALVLNALPSMPPLPYPLGMTAVMDKIVFLPKRHPRVVAATIKAERDFTPYVRSLEAWLLKAGLSVDIREEFLPHITIARAPLDFKGWRQGFVRLPVVLSHLNLYESLGQLNYRPVQRWSLPPPFEEIEHTADIAFLVRALTLPQLYDHALVALAFSSPEILAFKSEDAFTFASLDEVISGLNHAIAHLDAKMGSPFKAVSYHGHVARQGDLLLWEMIVDV